MRARSIARPAPRCEGDRDDGLPSNSELTFQVRAINAAGLSPASAPGPVVTPEGSCVESERTLCLNDHHFEVEVFWEILEGGLAGEKGFGKAIPLSEDTGYFCDSTGPSRGRRAVSASSHAAWPMLSYWLKVQ